MTRTTRRWSRTVIEAQARDVLAAGGDARLPVPLPRIAQALGVRVEGAQLGDEVTAVLVVGGAGSTIGYNWYQPSCRQRFGIAHALGHYLLHRTTATLFIDTTFALPGRAAAAGKDAQEDEATQFALALLLPPDEVRDRARSLRLDYGDDAALTVLARTFDVSPLALLLRLLTLAASGEATGVPGARAAGRTRRARYQRR